MKKILALCLMLSGGVYLTSCDDSLLDPFTPGALLGDNVIQTPDDVQLLTNTMYGALTDVSEISFAATFTDESAIGYANGGQGLGDDHTWFLNGSSGAPNGIWANHYLGMAYVNRVIFYAAEIEAATVAEQQQLDRLKAEALTMRAYSHTQLLAHFSTNPKDPNALGVILNDQVFPVGYQGTRSTNAEVYALIDSDLTEAIALFNAVGAPTTPITANINFAYAMRARSMALRGDYANAEIAADWVINNSGLNLATFSNYMNVFHTDNNAANSEVIFKFKQGNGDIRVGGIWASVNTTVSGSPFFEIGRGLFNDLNPTDDASATDVTITAIAPFSAAAGGSVLTIPGNTMQVGDMFVASQSFPATAQMALNGTSTIPGNAMVAGKVYYVKSVNGDNVTLTDTANSTTNINFNAAAAGVPLQGKTSAGDIRYATVVAPSSIIRPDYQTVGDYKGLDKLAWRKYPGTTANGLLVNDIKVSRLSEMYMIKAEARVAAGDLAGAATQIKTIRDARFNRPQPLPVYSNATEAWKDILLERKKEFAGEGFRFVDLKRLGALAGEGIQRYSRDCEMAQGACSLPVTDYLFTLPIPTVESNPNPGILSQQNPGY